MIFHEPPANPAGADPVRLFAFGAAGQHFVRALQQGATGPLAQMLADLCSVADPVGSIESLERDELRRRVDALDLSGVAFLFIAVGADATCFEVGEAVMLVFRAKESGVNTIAVAVPTWVELVAQRTATGDTEPGASHSSTSLTPIHRPAALYSFLLDYTDGRIDVRQAHLAHDLEAIRWLYGTLRALAREGVLILEPAWDLHDITEVLDLPGARLVLLTRAAEAGETAVTAVQDALADLLAQGIELALVAGVLLIVWQERPHRLTVQEVRTVSRLVREALGGDGQHLVLTARATSPLARADDVGACATLVVSRGVQRDAGGAP